MATKRASMAAARAARTALDVLRSAAYRPPCRSQARPITTTTTGSLSSIIGNNSFSAKSAFRKDGISIIITEKRGACCYSSTPPRGLSDQLLTKTYPSEKVFGEPSSCYCICRWVNSCAKEVVHAFNGCPKVTYQALEGKYEPLEQYGEDLTKLARSGELNYVMNRSIEVDRCVQMLSQETKCAPVVIGNPGKERTKVANGLAHRIVYGDVPETLVNRKLISIDLGSLLAGAKSRVVFEQRLKAVLNEVAASNGQIILHVDEIHIAYSAGANGGEMDAGNLLSLMLERGELRCIGATTSNGYKQNIGKDVDLKHRFEKVSLCYEGAELDLVSVLIWFGAVFLVLVGMI